MLVGTLISRAVTARVPASWVKGDEVYGADSKLRAAIRGHGPGYVRAIATNRRVPTPRGRIRVNALPTLIPQHIPGRDTSRALALLVPLDQSVHARLRLPGCRHRRRTGAHPLTGLIALTVNEFRRLLDAVLIAAKHTVETLLTRSRWQRRHQCRARLFRYRRREHL